MQHENAPKDTFIAERLMNSIPGRAQTPMASHIDADVKAICELQECIQHLWGNLSVHSREDLRARLDLLIAAAEQRATDSRPVRQALQEVLLSVGTGAVATLSAPTRQRLAALTGIALPDHLPPRRRVTYSQGDAGIGNEQAEQAGQVARPHQDRLGH